MTRVLAVLVMLAASTGGWAQARENASAGDIFVVRHAERVDEKTDALSAVGQERAACLAATLKDAKVAAVITSTLRRTQQTGAPTAKEFDLREQPMTADDFKAIAERARTEAAKGNVLIVGHSNTVPQIVKELSGTDVTVGATDYDRLFVVGGKGVTVLHYCITTKAEPESRMK